MSEEELYETQTVYQAVHKDRRKLPRIEVRVPAKVQTGDGEVHGVTVHDVSKDGLQVRCDKAIAAAIHPKGRSIREEEDGPELKIAFQVPLREGRGKVTVEGRMIYFALIGPNLASIGMRFSAVSSAGLVHLHKLFEEALSPEG